MRYDELAANYRTDASSAPANELMILARPPANDTIVAGRVRIKILESWLGSKAQ
jgi:hypothetical protein